LQKNTEKFYFPFLDFLILLGYNEKEEQIRENIMKEYNIRLSTIEDVRSFVNVVSLCEYDVDVSCGRYIVDGKSIIGLFSLDLLSPLRMTVHTDDVGDLEDRLARFLERTV
jgi:hypothetical protein